MAVGVLVAFHVPAAFPWEGTACPEDKVLRCVPRTGLAVVAHTVGAPRREGVPRGDHAPRSIL